MAVTLDNDPGTRVLIYGADGSTLRKVVVDTSGNISWTPAGSTALADNLANPTTVEVGANQLVWDAVNFVWLRALAAKINGNSFDAATLKPPVSVILAWDGTSGVYKPLQAGRGIGDGNVGDTSLTTAPMGFNGTNWDKGRNNHEVTVLASAARTATTTSSDQTNFNARGMLVTIDVTTMAAGGLTPAVKAKSSLANKYTQLHAAFAKIVAVGTYRYLFAVGAGVAAGDITAVASVIVPRLWQIVITADDATSITYSVDANYVN